MDERDEFELRRVADERWRAWERQWGEFSLFYARHYDDLVVRIGEMERWRANTTGRIWGIGILVVAVTAAINVGLSVWAANYHDRQLQAMEQSLTKLDQRPGSCPGG